MKSLLPFMPVLMKGDDVPILNGNSRIDDAVVAQSMLNAIILPRDLAKYSVVSIMTLTTHYEEILYEERVMLPLLYHLNSFLIIYYAPF